MDPATVIWQSSRRLERISGTKYYEVPEAVSKIKEEISERQSEVQNLQPKGIIHQKMFLKKRSHIFYWQKKKSGYYSFSSKKNRKEIWWKLVIIPWRNNLNDRNKKLNARRENFYRHAAFH